VTEGKTFEPITTQEEFDDRIKTRLARERDKWSKEEGVTFVQAELDRLKAANRDRDVREQLAANGFTDSAQQDRLLRLMDVDKMTSGDLRLDVAVKAELASVSEAFPGILPPEDAPSMGGGSGGSRNPVGGREEAELTKEQIEAMSSEERRENMGRIDRWLQRQRGVTPNI